ncbi:hypothetical protein GCM10010398_08880 [Streptomyces fimbriatus]
MLPTTGGREHPPGAADGVRRPRPVCRAYIIRTVNMRVTQTVAKLPSCTGAEFFGNSVRGYA